MMNKIFLQLSVIGLTDNVFTYNHLPMLHFKDYFLYIFFNSSADVLKSAEI